MALNVFISSTGKDLADYRQAAIDTCNRLQLIPIAMEFFSAMGQGATEGSKKKVDESNLYVGIFAHRYGYIEHGYEKSVTETEFDYAGERRLDRLCFLVKSDYPWPPELIDYEQHAQLVAFKQKVNTSVIRAEFTTVEDFQIKLVQALVEWLDQHTTSSSNEKITIQAPILNLPPQPSLFIGRETDVVALKKRLGIPPGPEESRQTIVRGWPGVGKTTLLLSLAYDPSVKEVYRDGVLWTGLGEFGDPLSELNNWGHQLGLPEMTRATTLDMAIKQVRAVLQSKKMLLLVDDVWNRDAGIPFKQVCGSECAIFLTTRFGDVARELGIPEDVYVLGILDEVQGLQLLKRVAPTVVKKHPGESQHLVHDLEGLPLAIRVAGRLLESEIALGKNIQDLMEELSESHILLNEYAPDDRFDPRTGTTPTISLLLKSSTDRLDETMRIRFSMLGAFADEPATFDLEAMRFIWDVDDPLPTVRVLVDRGLLEPIVSQGRFQMHKMLALHARALLRAEEDHD